MPHPGPIKRRDLIYYLRQAALRVPTLVVTINIW